MKRQLFLFLLLAAVSQIFGQQVPPGHGSRDSRMIALTLDDGWVADYPLIDYLESTGIPWTAFVPGKIAASRPEWIKRMAEMGVPIGSHGYTHHWLTAKTDEEIRWELSQSKKVLTELSGSFYPYFRPPAGQYDQRVLDIARELGYSTVLWDNDVGGYSEAAKPEDQFQSMLNRLEGGNIILAHFGASLHTEEVLRKFIPEAQKRGYRFVPLEDVLATLD